MRNITVGYYPKAIAANTASNMVYAIGSNNAVYIIDGKTDKIQTGVRFNINPANSGHIKCNNQESPTNQYLRIEFGTQCVAESNNGFGFNNWIENLGHNSSKTISTSAVSNSPFNTFLAAFGFITKDNAAIFHVSQFGNFTANFKEVPPPIPPEYWIPLYGIVVSSIVGWSIPSIIGWIKVKRQGRRINQYHKRIKCLRDDGKLDDNDIKDLNKLRKDITDAYAKGKISEQHYGNLKSEISILYEEIYDKRIHLLIDTSNISDNDNGILLNKLRNDITDAYAKGKISEQHYSLLNKKILDNNSHN
jgi:uncharacterized membrane protein